MIQKILKGWNVAKEFDQFWYEYKMRALNDFWALK